MRTMMIVLTLIILSMTVSAQSITNTLGTGGDYIIRDAANQYLTFKQSTGLMGLGAGVITPRAQLEIGGTEGMLVTGTFNSGITLNLGAGTRLHWYPKRGAFRAGRVTGNQWNSDNIGDYSVAMGHNTQASGSYSIAMGINNQASGDVSIAMGANNIASGAASVAIGNRANTDNLIGAVIITDYSSSSTTTASVANQLTMRFCGGYRLFTNSDHSTGVYMNAGESGWNNYCDRNKKENFKVIDNETLLNQLQAIPVTRWNYIGSPTIDYIGPMAQDFYAAFHLGGQDSLGINSICIDGVTLAGVKALEERTRSMKSTIDSITIENHEIKNSFTTIQAENHQIKTAFSVIQTENQDQRSRIDQLTRDNREMKTQLARMTETLDRLAVRERTQKSASLSVSAVSH